MAGLHEVARQAGVRDAEASAVFEALTTFLHQGQRVIIKGFGTFELKEYKSRTVTSPLLPDGKASVPRYKRIKFKASKMIRSALDGTPIGEQGKANGIPDLSHKPMRAKRRKYFGTGK